MNKYNKGKVLGQGSFGRAILVTDKTTGQRYVMKEIDVSRMPQSEREAAKLEARVLQVSPSVHPHISWNDDDDVSVWVCTAAFFFTYLNLVCHFVRCSR